jgi:predicted secreted hydrolase
MDVAGTLYVNEQPRAVRGSAWMDHQWGDFLVMGGWDWFSLHLDDQTELMLTFTRAPDGSPALAFGTHVEPDGSARDLEASAFAVVPTGSWTSPHTGATYPSGWQVSVPECGLELAFQPTVLDQELLTNETTGITYWEGQIEARGTRRGEPVTGLGYVELVGYATPPPRAAAPLSTSTAAENQR